jgi:hypothetical protein
MRLWFTIFRTCAGGKREVIAALLYVKYTEEEGLGFEIEMSVELVQV